MVLIIRPICASSSYSGGRHIIKQDSRKVFEALYTHDGELLTIEDVAKITNLKKSTVDGIFTSAIQRKNFGTRTLTEIKSNDGTYKAVKFLSLTPAGKRFAEENFVKTS